jgi:hypothetical protein
LGEGREIGFCFCVVTYKNGMLKMLKKIIFIITLICMGFTQPVSAQINSAKQSCSKSIIKAVGKHLGIKNFSFAKENSYASEESGIIAAGTCKLWPNDNSITIAAFAYEDKSDINGKSLFVAIIDNLNYKIIANYKAGQIDYVGFGVAQDGLRLDTARYNLAPGVRAFGIDITEQYNHNCGGGSGGPYRSLFIRNGSEIKPIAGFLTSYSEITGACGDPEKMEPVIETTISISIGKKITNGYTNLLITEVSTTWEGNKPKKKISQNELEYDGEKYVPVKLPKTRSAQ